MSINKWFAALLSCSALALAACGGQKTDTAPAASNASAPVAEVKTFRVATNAEFAPFESLNEKQEIYGFDVDVLNAMAKAGGFSVQFQHKPWDSLLPALNNGDVDMVISGMTITEERKQNVDFSDVYYQLTQIILTQPNKDIQTVEDLKKMNKVGVVTGYTGDIAAQKILGATNPIITRFDSAPLMLKEMENGGLDAAIGDSAVVAEYVKNNNNKGFKMVKVPDFEIENYGIAVRKGDTETLTLLNNALKAIHENGEYAKIEAKYFAK